MAAAETLPKELKVLIIHNDVSNSTEESEKDVLDEVAQLQPSLEALKVPYKIVPVADPRDLGETLARFPEYSVIWNFYEATVSDYAPGSLMGEAVPIASELFGKGCTGGTTYGLSLTLDKALTKRALRAVGVPVARDVEVTMLMSFSEFENLYNIEFGGNQASKILVKPTCADASEGIVWNKSIFAKGATAKDVWQRVDEVRKAMQMPVLVEEMVGSGELNVSIIEDPNPRVLAIAEMDFSALPPGCPHIVDWEGKWDPKSPMYNSQRRLPAVISEKAAEEVKRVAIASWNATQCRDYGRVDMRFDLLPDGNIKVWVLEVNMNPDVSPGSGFLAAVEYVGMGFTGFVRNTILNAFNRSKFNPNNQKDKNQKKAVGKLN